MLRCSCHRESRTPHLALPEKKEEMRFVELKKR
ncbi:BnaC04g26020D [Brassica napus]|uniref:BnaC04g26020D protein n=1 Tax=Brassica napus TaxID=3708 RepID=A0A078FLS9_BRANA|nr:BnaC04g26020D [Brassica napus]